jgi:DNA mismatch repair protein MutS2
MGFEQGERVRVKPLKKDGVITGTASGGRYRVQVGSMNVLCNESDLTRKEIPAKKTSKKRYGRHNPDATMMVSKEVQNLRQKKKRFQKLHDLDLHGKTVAEALPLVESFLNDAILAGYDRAEIVHGLGTGALQNAVHKQLREIATIAEFRIKEGNPGTTVVFFR